MDRGWKRCIRSTPRWTAVAVPEGAGAHRRAVGTRRPTDPAACIGGRFLGLAGGAGALGGRSAPSSDRVRGTTLFGGGVDARRRHGPTPAAGNLVLLTLYGGNDGLNTVIPYREPGLRRRPGARSPWTPRASSRWPKSSGCSSKMPGFQEAVGRTGARHRPRRRVLRSQLQPLRVHGHLAERRSRDAGRRPGGSVAGSTGPSRVRCVPSRSGPRCPTALSGERVQGAAIPVGPLVLPGSAPSRRQYRVAGPRRPRRPLAGGGECRRRTVCCSSCTSASARCWTARRPSNPLHLPDESSLAAGARQPGHRQRRRGASRRQRAGGAAQRGGQPDPGGGNADVYSVELGGFDTHADQVPVQSTLLSRAGHRRDGVRRRPAWDPTTGHARWC